MDPPPPTQPPEPVKYICGGCGEENILWNVMPGVVLTCTVGECRYPILYKKRPRRIVQYDAR